MNYLFPIAFMLNTFTMTGLMVILGISGQSQLAADVGIIQGAITALFFSFSANSRSIILNPTSGLSLNSILKTRLILIIPLAIASYLLSVLPSNADKLIIIALIMRRCIEWVSELHLSEMELLEEKKFARTFIYLQIFVFVLALSWLLSGFPRPSIGLFIWALAPVLVSTGFIREKLKERASFQCLWTLMLPQFGSTMIIGITLYVFRLIILLIAGKEIAGILFTAFALGGMVGSIFAQVLGPSVVLYEDINKKTYFTFKIKLLLSVTVLMGIIIFVCSEIPELYKITFSIFERSNILWGSIGASLVGGVIMVYAQRIRFRILQLYGDSDLFGPDLLMNLFIIACVPYIYYIVGSNALMILYLISASFAYVFYRCAEKQDIGNEKQFSFTSSNIFGMSVAFIIILPVFIQFKSGLFNERAMIYDSQGILMNLPIPISVFACFVCIPLISRYRHAYLSLTYIFIIYVAMLVASLVSTGRQDDDISAKMIFVLQFILPMVALVLGQLYESRQENNESMSKAFLYVVMVIVPLQLISTWVHGTYTLYPQIIVFSIYQHLQYVPLIFVSAYLIAIYSLWRSEEFKMLLMIYIPIIGIYATVSQSVMAIIMFYLGITAFAIQVFNKEGINKCILLAVIISALLTLGYLSYGRNDDGFLKHVDRHGDIALQDDNAQWTDEGYGNIPVFDKFKRENMRERILIWKYHVNGIMSGFKEFVFGHPKRPDREKIKSANNYYLDIMYNFGFISTFPLICLIGITVKRLYKKRRKILTSPEMYGIVIVILFIIFVDNSLKVGLRQPYSGIFSFFIWGILLTKLEKEENQQESRNR